MKQKKRILLKYVFLAMKIRRNIQFMYQKDFVNKNMWRRRKETLCADQRF